MTALHVCLPLECVTHFEYYKMDGWVDGWMGGSDSLLDGHVKNH